MTDKSNREDLDMAVGDRAVNFLKSYLKPNFIFLEWGAGKSTAVFSCFVKEYYSIEHNFKDYKNSLAKAGKNVKIYYAPPNLNTLQWFPYVFRDGSFGEFKNYVQFADVLGSLNKKFDVVLIDGRARVECAKQVLPYLAEGAVVFLHDFHRHLYWDVLEHYYIEKIEDNLVALRKKPEIKLEVKIKDRIFLMQKYLINPALQ